VVRQVQLKPRDKFKHAIVDVLKRSTGAYGVANATEGALESMRRTIGVYAGSSTFEPLAMNAL
jgi:hypothetical protein